MIALIATDVNFFVATEGGVSRAARTSETFFELTGANGTVAANATPIFVRSFTLHHNLHKKPHPSRFLPNDIRHIWCNRYYFVHSP